MGEISEMIVGTWSSFYHGCFILLFLLYSLLFLFLGLKL